jgi:hypothetical protein
MSCSKTLPCENRCITTPLRSGPRNPPANNVEDSRILRVQRRTAGLESHLVQHHLAETNPMPATLEVEQANVCMMQCTGRASLYQMLSPESRHRTTCTYYLTGQCNQRCTLVCHGMQIYCGIRNSSSIILTFNSASTVALHCSCLKHAAAHA